MTTYAANRQGTGRVPWVGLSVFLALVAGFILFIAMVVIPWQDRRDARGVVRAQQQLETLHELGFVHVTSNDYYTSSYYNGPTAFQYPVGTCSIEVILDGSGANTRPYIWLKSVEDTKLYVTFRQLSHIPQTKACYSR